MPDLYYIVSLISIILRMRMPDLYYIVSLISIIKDTYA